MRTAPIRKFAGANIVFWHGIRFGLVRQSGHDPFYQARLTDDEFNINVAHRADKAIRKSDVQVTIDGITWTHEIDAGHWSARMTARRSEVLINAGRLEIDKTEKAVA